MNMRVLLVAVVVFSIPAFPQSLPLAAPVIPAADGVYQLHYLANLDKSDSFINITNAGTLNGNDPTGRICVNIYAFDFAEELLACCACPVTPNGLNFLSAQRDLLPNTLFFNAPTSMTIKLLAGTPNAGGFCNPASPTATNLVRGMRAWLTTPHLNTTGSPAVGYQLTETEFSKVELSATELVKIVSFCAFIQANGSGFGICKSCRLGALGAEQK